MINARKMERIKLLS